MKNEKNFEKVIKKAIISCDTTGADSSQEFFLTPAKTIDKGGRPGRDYIPKKDGYKIKKK